MSKQPPSMHVSLVAIPDSMALPINGIYESLQIFNAIGGAGPSGPVFEVEIVGRERGELRTPSGLSVTVHRRFDEVERTDIAIATSMAPNDEDEWLTGRYPEAVRWLREMHSRQAVLCSGCTGVLLLAETELLDGLDATVHWAYEPTFRRNFPKVRLRLEEVLLTGGSRRELVMAGATSSWQDLMLYLLNRYAGTVAAQALARFMLFQWHADSQTPYISFSARTEHGDAVIGRLQEWLREHLSVAHPVEEMGRRSGLPDRTFKRRFKQATGFSPLHYVQQLRVEQAKRRLEQTDEPVEDISWEVGYEDPAFFRRIFKRTTRLTPSQYRRKFRIPDFAQVSA